MTEAWHCNVKKLSYKELKDLQRTVRLELYERTDWMYDYFSASLRNILQAADIGSQDDFLSFFARRGVKLRGMGPVMESQVADAIQHLKNTGIVHYKNSDIRDISDTSAEQRWNDKADDEGVPRGTY